MTTFAGVLYVVLMLLARCVMRSRYGCGSGPQSLAQGQVTSARRRIKQL